MRTTSLKSIYLTEKELKQAIANWIKSEHNDVALASHLKENECDMVWSQDGMEFILTMDGEFMDDEELVSPRPPAKELVSPRPPAKEIGYSFEGNELED